MSLKIEFGSIAQVINLLDELTELDYLADIAGELHSSIRDNGIPETHQLMIMLQKLIDIDKEKERPTMLDQIRKAFE